MPLTSGSEESDEQRQARAYNNSVYLMVGMPYLLLGGVCYLVYRGLRQRAALAQLSGGSYSDDLPACPYGGPGSCPPSSPGGDS